MMLYPLRLSSLLVAALPYFSTSQDSSSTAAIGGQGCTGPRSPGELRAALLAGYDSDTRPGVAQALQNFAYNQPPPDVARVQFHVLSLNGVDQKRSEFELSIWFRRSWHDNRLNYTSTSQGGCFADDGRVGFSENILNEIWAPDFYIENQAKPSSRIAGSVWIYPSGKVVHVTQLNLFLTCQMQFEDFPLDVQNCGIRVGTFLEDASSVTLEFFEDIDPVTLDPNGGTNEWKILDAHPVAKTALAGATQTESVVEVQFDLARNADYYTDFVIIPAVIFVVIGWLSFFLNRSAAPARVTMSMIGFLANTNFLAAQLGQLPRLGNDVWLLTFLSVSAWFSFYAILEYVLCNWLRRIEARIDCARDMVQCKIAKPPRKKRKKKHQDQELPEQPPVTKEDLKAAGFYYKVDLLMMKSNTKMYFKDEHLDVFSRYAYPITYVIVYTAMLYSQ